MPKPGIDLEDEDEGDDGCVSGGGISKRGTGWAMEPGGGGSMRDLSVTGPAGYSGSSTGTGMGVGKSSGASWNQAC